MSAANLVPLDQELFSGFRSADVCGAGVGDLPMAGAGGWDPMEVEPLSPTGSGGGDEILGDGEVPNLPDYFLGGRYGFDGSPIFWNFILGLILEGETAMIQISGD